MYFSNSNVYVSQGILVVRTEKCGVVDSTTMNLEPVGNLLSYMQYFKGFNSVMKNEIEVFMSISSWT